MLTKSKAHLRAAGETYFEHFRFATTFGLLAMAAGVAALIHAIVPALCSSTASRTIRLLALLVEDRDRLDEIEAHSIEAKAFILLLILSTVVVAPLWLLDAPSALRGIYTVLAYSLPLALLLTSHELDRSEESAA